MLGVNVDNGTEFLNGTVIDFMNMREVGNLGIAFTHSRAYKIKKIRIGAWVVKKYDAPKTPPLGTHIRASYGSLLVGEMFGSRPTTALVDP